MYFSALKSILLRGLGLNSWVSHTPSSDAGQRSVDDGSLEKRQQPGDTTAGGQIIFSIPADGDTYGGVPAFNWTQVSTSFIANSTAVIFSILVRNDPSFFSFDDFSCTAPGSDANLIVNPGFESGTTEGWYPVGVSGLPYAGYLATNNTSVPHSGEFDFYDGAVGGVDGISQTVSTVPGTNYSVSFWISEQDPVHAGVAALAQSVVSDFGPPSNLSLTPETDSGNDHTDGITNEAEPVLVGNASPKIGVNIYLNGTLYATVNSTQNGTFTFPFPSDLPLGETAVTASSVVGNSISTQSTPPFIITYIPASMPTIELESSSFEDDGDAVVLEGIGAPNTNITILDGIRVIGSVISNSNGTYTFVAPDQSYGLHSYSSQEPVDAAGNIRVSSPLGVDILGPPDICDLEL